MTGAAPRRSECEWCRGSHQRGPVPQALAFGSSQYLRPRETSFSHAVGRCRIVWTFPHASANQGRPLRQAFLFRLQRVRLKLVGEVFRRRSLELHPFIRPRVEDAELPRMEHLFLHCHPAAR